MDDEENTNIMTGTVRDGMNNNKKKKKKIGKKTVRVHGRINYPSRRFESNVFMMYFRCFRLLRARNAVRKLHGKVPLPSVTPTPPGPVMTILKCYLYTRMFNTHLCAGLRHSAFTLRAHTRVRSRTE